MPTLLLLTMLLTGPAHAGIVLPDPPSDEATAAPDAGPFTVLSQEVRVRIVDQVATTTLSQVLRNDTGRATGGTFTLPLSDQASVQELAFWVGGRRVVSTIQRREDAARTVDEAERRGERAALLQRQDGDSFTARITTMQPGETRRIEVLYSELLPYEDGLVRYRHPLGDTGAARDVLVDVQVEDSKPITDVRSPGHPALAIARRDDRRLQATWRAEAAPPDGDFELDYRVESRDFGLAFRTFAQGGDEGFFVAMIAPREEAGQEDIVNKDIAFVFDVSGSMGGPKIEQAREALKGCLNLMNPGDGAFLLAFNDSLNPWQARVRDLDEENRRQASAFSDGLRAGGGTNIQGAVLGALQALEGSERPTAIVFLTDGLGQSPPEETLQAVADANPGGRTRIFASGVGQDVNRPFLERLGRENRGGFTAIRGDVPIDRAVADFYSGISKPVLTDLSLDFGDVVPNRLYPAVLPDVYKGQRLVITGRYRGAGPSTLTVRGRIGEQERTLELPVDFPSDAPGDRWVARLWAKRRAEHLLAGIRMYGETPEAKDEVIALSTAYGFATPYTSLVAHADPRVASLIPARIKPGDPVLAIPAPPDSVAVTAFLPFGEVKDLVLDRDSGLWVTRFLVPRSVEDGVYWIHIVATRGDGGTRWFQASYTVDTRAPVVEVSLDRADGRYSAGDVIVLTARPVVGFLELGEEMIRTLGRDLAARAKAFVDIKAVVVHLDGAALGATLRTDAERGPGWHGELELPVDLPPGPHRLEITATDVAGNKNTVTAEIVVTREQWIGLRSRM